MSEKVPKVVLCDRRYTFARFSEDDLHFSSRCSTLDVSCCVFFFCELHCQRRANRVAGVGHCESVILRGRRKNWDSFVIAFADFHSGTAAQV